jgi:hypothetical protein
MIFKTLHRKLKIEKQEHWNELGALDSCYTGSTCRTTLVTIPVIRYGETDCKIINRIKRGK